MIACHSCQSSVIYCTNISRRNDQIPGDFQYCHDFQKLQTPYHMTWIDDLKSHNLTLTEAVLAIPPTPLIPADSRTMANHNYKYKNISTSSARHKNRFFARTIGTLWIKILLTVHPRTSSRTVYHDLLSVYLPIGMISLLPSREFADYQAETEIWLRTSHSEGCWL